MEDVNISKYRAQVVRAGSTPASPGFVVSEGQDPVNPSGSSNYVPYSGAISNVDFGEFGLDTGFVTLDTTPTNIPTEQGGIYWDDARSTAALIMNGTLQHIGQDTFFYVKNSTGSSIPKGTAVRFNGTDGASGHLLIAPFLANGTYPSNYFMGVTAEAIANGSFGQVMHFGELTGVNTSGYTAGALLYASTSVAGAFQTTAPVAPNNIVLVAAAINSTNNGTILVRPTYGSNINQDEGVKITSGTTGDLLQLQAGGLWENKTLTQVIGSAYVPSTRTITINGTTQDLSANRTYNVGTVTAVTASSPLFSSGGTTPNITIQQASGSQNGFLSSTDWTTFNNKQNALTNPVTGTGTTNYLPKFTGASTIGNSQVFDNGTNVGVGTASPTGKLMVYQSVAGNVFLNIISNQGGSTQAGINFSPSMTDGELASNPAQASIYATDSNYGANIIFASKSTGAVNNALAERMRIWNSTGNVNIGSTPASDAGFKLDVNGTGRFTNTLTPIILRSTNANTMWTEYYYNTSTLSGYVGSGSGLLSGANASDFIVRSEADFVIATGGNNRRLTLASTGAATFSSSVTAGGEYYASVNNTYLRGRNSSNTAYIAAIGINGSNRVAIDPDNNGSTFGGNVGIGTTSPAYPLDIQSTSGALGISLRGRLSDDISLFTFFNNAANTQLAKFTAASTYLGIDVGGNERMRITSGGNVLIGTTTDIGVKLYVKGSAATNLFLESTGASVYQQFSNSSGNAYIGATSNDLVFLTTGAGTERMRISSGGSVGINNTSPMNSAWGNDTNTKQLSINGSSYAVINLEGSTGRKYSMGVGDGNFYMCYDNTAARHNITVSSGGNVLINTTTSGSSKLRIVGLPTSSAGLSSGDVYSLAGTLMIA